jgi:hypothetical protein
MKRGYFFTIDAFVAISALVLCIIMILSIRSTKPYQVQSVYLSDDVLYMMSNTKLYELQNDYTRSLYKDGSITNMDNTVIEQAAIFYATGRDSLAKNFLLDVTNNVIPGKYGFQIRLYNTSDAYEYTIYPGEALQSESRLLISSKKIVFGIVDETGNSWGPMTAEVRLWQ